MNWCIYIHVLLCCDADINRSSDIVVVEVMNHP